MKKIKRREFLKTAGVAAAASTLAAPAIAQSMPEIKWRLAASWPKALDTLFGGCEDISKYVAEMTDNKFQIQSFAGGEIVPGLQVLDACSNGTVEMAHTATYYFFGKDPTWALFCAFPFGLNARMQNAWFAEGDGQKLMDEFSEKKFGVHCILAGNTGCQMGGWFRKEINSVADLKGLKFRIGGFGGKTIAKLGAVPQSIAGGDIYPSLEKGTIDAAEWVGPYDDEKLGFYKVAKHYYYPGWWEGGTAIHAMVNQAKWQSLPKNYKAILEAACAHANINMLGKYDARNPLALKRLLAGGTKLHAFSRPIMDACLKAVNEVHAEESAKNPPYKKVLASIDTFKSNEYDWFQIAEYTYDDFMIRSHGKGWK